MKLLNNQARIIMAEQIKLIPGRPFEFKGNLDELKAVYPRIAQLITEGAIVVIDDKAAQEAERKLNELTIEKLKEYAAAKGINLDGATKKDEIIAAIEAAMQ